MPIASNEQPGERWISSDPDTSDANFEKDKQKYGAGGQFHGSCFLIQWVKYLIGETNADVDKRYSDLFTKSVSLGGGNGPKQEVLGLFG